MLSYRPAVTERAMVSKSVWPFHLPAVAVDLGHYAESGVTCSESFVVYVCVSLCVCVGVQENKRLNVP